MQLALRAQYPSGFATARSAIQTGKFSDGRDGSLSRAARRSEGLDKRPVLVERPVFLARVASEKQGGFPPQSPLLSQKENAKARGWSALHRVFEKERLVLLTIHRHEPMKS